MATNITAVLPQRILSAGLWSVTLRGALRTVGLVRNILLARILAPSDLGLFGIALVILSILDRFSNTGLQAALIQKKEDIEDYLDTAWTIQAVRGLALGIGVFLGAEQFAEFFNEPRAASFIRMLAVVLALRGVASPGIVVFIRQLEFKTHFMRRVSGNVVELAVSLAFALVFRNAWALMIGLVAGNLTNVVMSYWIHPFRPKFRFQLGQARQLSHYGRWIFLNEVLYFLSYRGDNLIVGKFLGPATLGVYMIAYSISEVLTVEISGLINDVAFPTYSRLQGELSRIRSAFIFASQLLISCAFPMAVVLSLLAGPLLDLMFDARWAEAATVLPVLALAGALRAAVSNASAVYRAVGRPDLSFKSSLIRVAVMYALMFPLLRYYGALGVSLAVLGGTIAVVPEFVIVTRRLLNFTAREFGAMCAPGLVLGATVGIAVEAWLLCLGQPSGYEVPLLLLAVIGAYALASAALWRTARTGPFQLLPRIISAARLRGIASAPPSPSEV
jgi:O-antigen/teichoic acid export membrane protein